MAEREYIVTMRVVETFSMGVMASNRQEAIDKVRNGDYLDSWETGDRQMRGVVKVERAATPNKEQEAGS